MNKKPRKPGKPRKLQRQIAYIFILTFELLFFVNIYIFRSMRSVIESMDSIYDGSRRLIEMRELIDSTQSILDDYINTKDEGELNRFYENIERYKQLTADMRHDGWQTKQQMQENAIANLSENYIRIVNTAVLSKRSGDVKQYQEDYALSQSSYSNLTGYITIMNSQIFQDNSETYGKMYEAMRYSEYIYTLILLMMGIMDICVILLLIRKLLLPLQKLADTAKEVGEGNLEVQVAETQEYNEIGIVNRAFHDMIISLKEYIRQFRNSVEQESLLREKAIRMEADVKDAQLKYLQAQINPHFLFNTLNAGAQLAMIEDADRTYQYILRVADFFRSKIKNDDGSSTLREELKIVNDYLYIINVRFAGEIHYEQDVDEHFLNISIPSMTLQPLVENCIKHGLRNVEWEKKIELSVSEEEENIVIAIRDNGVGIPEEIIPKLLEDTLPEDADGNQSGGVGLGNVNNRLKVFYDSDKVMEITSVGKDMGTEIALLIPKESRD